MMCLKVSQISQENACVGVQVLSCEICEIFKKTYFEEHLGTTTSGKSYQHMFSIVWAIPLKIAFP